MEGLALIFGVYRFMSMLSVLCNVIGQRSRHSCDRQAVR
ncbi:MAG: hypothetical protein WDN49_23960 [Acetobacteraceae bacterium]